MDDIYIVEFNWEQIQMHAEPLTSRLEKNLRELLWNGRPGNIHWIPIAILPSKQAFELCEKFPSFFVTQYKQNIYEKHPKKEVSYLPPLELVSCILLDYIFSLPIVYKAKELPRASGVYFLCFNCKAVVYVGSSVDLLNRWNGHSLKNYLNDSQYHLHYWAKSSDDPFSVQLVESCFISVLQPKLNRAGVDSWRESRQERMRIALQSR